MIFRYLLFSLACCCVVCCQKETQTARYTKQKTLLVANGGEPKALDPQLVTGVIESRIITALMEGLVADDAKSDTAMPPGAAESWSHNENFTEWTFLLRKNGVWSDGKPLTAHDFVFAYHRMLHPDTAAPYASMLHFLKNAQAFNEGKMSEFSEVGVKAVDDHTLHLTMREPVPFLPDLTRHYTWFAVPKHTILRFGKMTDRHTKWTEPENFVSNGGFTLKSWQMNSHIDVVKNPNYWNAANVKLQGIRFFAIDNPATETRAYLAGQLHITQRVPAEMLQKLGQTHPKELRIEPYVGTQFIRFNTQRKGLDDARVRRALAMAIDREALCKSVYEGYTPADTMSPDLGNYKPETGFTFDPQQAQKLLAAAGFPEGKNFPRYKILTSGKVALAAQAIQAQWQKNLGVRVDIQSMDYASSIQAMQKLDYDIMPLGWIGDYLDPTTFLLMWKKGDGNNCTGWSNEKFEALLTQAAQRTSEAERLADFVQAEKLFMEEMPIAPLVWVSSLYMLDPSVKNWHPLMLNNHPWTSIDLEAENKEVKP